MEKEFVHHPLNEDVETISGHYTLLKEEVLTIAGRSVLYLSAVGVFDKTCCGSGGCGYAIVPGFLLQPHARRDPDGRPLSLVEPIRDRAVQDELETLIKEREVVSQVIFL